MWVLLSGMRKVFQPCTQLGLQPPGEELDADGVKCSLGSGGVKLWESFISHQNTCVFSVNRVSGSLLCRNMMFLFFGDFKPNTFELHCKKNTPTGRQTDFLKHN